MAPTAPTPAQIQPSVLIALATTHVAVDAVAGSVGALLPALGERFELTGAELGALVATFSASALLAQPLGGHLADRFGARRVAAMGAVTASVLLALLGSAPHVAAVHLLLILGGFGAAAFHPAAAAVARDAAPERAHAAVGVFAAGGLVGLAAGPIAALLLARAIGLAAVAVLMLPGALLGVLLAFRLPARSVQVERWDLGHRRAPVWPILVAATLSGLGVTAFTAGIPLWYAEHTSATTSSVGWSLAGFHLAGAFGGLVAAVVATRTSAAVTAGGALLLAPLPLAASLVAEPGGRAHLVLAVLGGALANAATPLLVAGAQQRWPGHVAAASGLVMGVANGVAGIGFVAVAALADAVGLGSALGLGFSAFVPAAIAAAAALRRADRPLPVAVSLPRALSCGCRSAAAA